MNKNALTLFTVSCLISTAFLTGLTLGIQPVRAEPKTWTVDDDGTADFQTIQQAINTAGEGDTIFVLNGTYYENVVVNKTLSLIGEDKYSTIIDGNNTGNVIHVKANNTVISGFAVQNSGQEMPYCGILLVSSRNSISHNVLRNTHYGIMLNHSSDTFLHGNSVADSYFGIHIFNSSGGTMKNNILRDSYSGICLSWCIRGGNIIRNNDIVNNLIGIIVDYSIGNVFFHNNMIDNEWHQVSVDEQSIENTWDNGYPSGGNYWSDYTSVDLNRGSAQNETSSDGIGDYPHMVTPLGTPAELMQFDNYPLMGMFSDFNATSEYNSQTICNSTISNFQFNGTTISFNVTGENGTVGFCRTCIPTALMNDTYRVFVNGTEVSYTLLPCSNRTHSYLYFTYSHSTQEVVIIPEFPSFLLLPILMISTLLAAILYRREHSVSTGC